MLHSRVTHRHIVSLYAAFQDAEGIYMVLVAPAPHRAKLMPLLNDKRTSCDNKHVANTFPSKAAITD